MGLFEHHIKTQNRDLQRAISKAKQYKIDTVLISTYRNCPLCGDYNLKTYSIYGWNRNFPKLPSFLHQRTCPQCEKLIGVSIDILADDRRR